MSPSQRLTVPRRTRLLAVAATAAVAAAAPGPAHAQVQVRDYDPEVAYVVNSSGDQADAAVGNQVCATAAGQCTLRAALQEAANDRATSRISFNFKLGGKHTITPATALPAIRDFAGPTIIDGSRPESAEGYWYRVELKGPGSKSLVDGLTITSTGNEVRGLAIYNFRNQIRITGWGNRVTGNLIGTDRDAAWVAPATDTPVERAGVVLDGDAANNRVGGDPGEGNTISGNDGHGVLIRGSASANRVLGNYIGVAPGNGGARPNLGHGVVLGPQTRFNVVGRDANNYIAANQGNGAVVGGTLNEISRNIFGRRELLANELDPTVAFAPNAATNVIVGPSTQARIRENELLGSSGGVSIGGGGITGARVLVNTIGGRGLSDPKRSTAIGVEVGDGAHVVVAYNHISSQNVGLVLRTPVLQEGNSFEFNARNVVGP